MGKNKDLAPGTRILDGQGAGHSSLVVRRSRLVVDKGVDAGKELLVDRSPLLIGSDPTCDLVLDDEAVSGRHFEISLTRSGVTLKDLGSTNGTTVDGLRVAQVFLGTSARIVAGQTRLRFATMGGQTEIPLSRATNFGGLLGHSPSMRAAFSVLEQASKTEATVLITGETGTGKELAARGIHERSARSEERYVVFDCGAASPSLIESQLFGHVKGAFTGATGSHAGLFEAAHQGTLVLDEIGELPPQLQPKLLRALENKTIQRVGQSKETAVDVRFVASTNRNLEQEVRQGRFRQDLLFRLSVISVHMPPLRDRKEEIKRLVRHFLTQQGAAQTDLPEATLDVMQSYDWPGNVRELRNFIERYLALPEVATASLIGPSQRDGQDGAEHQGATDLEFHEAKRRFTDRFELSYLSKLLEKHDGNVSALARAAGLSRQSCYRLMRKHGLRFDES